MTQRINQWVAPAETNTKAGTMGEKVRKDEAAWKRQLTQNQYYVTRQKGTEPPFTGEYEDTETAGTYKCVCCGQPLFRSETKFHSGSGWPSFYAPANEEAVDAETDTSHGMRRSEVKCSRCDAHLGHVFDDGPEPTGFRYCIHPAPLNIAKDQSKSDRVETAAPILFSLKGIRENQAAGQEHATIFATGSRSHAAISRTFAPDG